MLSFYLSLIDIDEEKSKFEVVYLKHRKVMMLEALKYLDEKLAEDAVHTAFVKIADNIKKIDDPADYKTRNFAVIITRNTALDMLKKMSRETELSENLAQTEQTPITDSPLEKLSKTYRGENPPTGGDQTVAFATLGVTMAVLAVAYEIKRRKIA